ncbi:type IV toxin-antitoxin system AbiEi family antitoxin [Mycolicibacterium sp. 120266]|uniref:type IV toxin-antitoxin system AbiEi family antitoxin n=1 Tax=Mycolicibacterium sp. 120266 TaxID=3090601 RepID=UPI00299DDA5F|nr:type IV toxin-antitoxin system AbiEi family antitoxin [Mycolicibacterium sp. 120266]MDX1870841.1 type IV toxin-antitoxin system AbiEi family antitoxin [Mycolicibacterium sp. 120266]
MDDAVLGPEALAAGRLTRSQLRWRYTTAHPRVYLRKGAPPDLFTNTVAAWLWSDRRAVIAGRAAAALHGAHWVDPTTPIELITEHRRPRPGIIVREERLAPGEICTMGDLRVTTPARTALDLARFLPRDEAVQHLDALARATRMDAAHVLGLAARYPGLRGIRQARTALALMDAGAQSPRETALRLLLVDEGFPRPVTQIAVSDGFNTAYLDMGWEEPRIGLEYDGRQHHTDRRQWVQDIGRNELIAAQGWINVHVVAEHGRRFIVRRVREAFARRGVPPFSAPGS